MGHCINDMRLHERCQIISGWQRVHRGSRCCIVWSTCVITDNLIRIKQVGLHRRIVQRQFGPDYIIALRDRPRRISMPHGICLVTTRACVPRTRLPLRSTKFCVTCRTRQEQSKDCCNTNFHYKTNYVYELEILPASLLPLQCILSRLYNLQTPAKVVPDASVSRELTHSSTIHIKYL